MLRKLFKINCYSKKEKRRRNENYPRKNCHSKEKLSKNQEGYTISEIASIGDEYNFTHRIENGLAMIEFVIKNNKVMKMLELVNKFRSYDSLKNDQSLRGITIHGNKKEEEEKNTKRKRKSRINRKSKEALILNIEKQERLKEESDKEKDENDDTFIRLEPVNGDTVQIDRSKLVEYDMFYKEEFLKNEVFKNDVDNIEDIEMLI